MVKSRKPDWLTRVLLYGIILFLILMIVGVIVFYFHYLHSPADGYKPWNTNDGMLMFTLFSALFAGFNVLAFIALTLAIERQNNEREKNIAFYDALRFKLQQQKEINQQLDELITRYVSYDSFFGKISSLHELKETEKIIKKDWFTLQTIKGLNLKEDNNQKTKQVELFFQVCDDDLNEAITFVQNCGNFIDKYAGRELFSTPSFAQRMSEFYTSQAEGIDLTLYAIKEGVELDMQLTLFHSLGLIGDSHKTREPKEDSLRYKSKQRREQ